MAKRRTRILRQRHCFVLHELTLTELHSVVNIRITGRVPIRRIGAHGCAPRGSAAEHLECVPSTLVAPLIDQRQCNDGTPSRVVGHQQGGEQNHIAWSDQDACIRSVDVNARPPYPTSRRDVTGSQQRP